MKKLNRYDLIRMAPDKYILVMEHKNSRDKKTGGGVRHIKESGLLDTVDGQSIPDDSVVPMPDAMRIIRQRFF